MLMLAARGMDITAAEPNEVMRPNGMKRTKRAVPTCAEGPENKLASPFKIMVTFGNSFNVCARPLALKETARS